MELQTIYDTSAVLRQLADTASQWAPLLNADDDLLAAVEDLHSACHAVCGTLDGLLLEDIDGSDSLSDHVSASETFLPNLRAIATAYTRDPCPEMQTNNWRPGATYPAVHRLDPLIGQRFHQQH